MSKLSGALHISSSLKREAEPEDANDQNYIGLSSDTLSARLNAAAHVTLISAYYDIDFLKSLKYPKNSLRSLNLVVSRLAGSALRNQIEELQVLKDSIQNATGKNTLVSMLVASPNRMLHTKLYHFRNGKWARTLIGSANATNNGFYRNDEILVEVLGRDTVIEGYIDYTLKKATECSDYVFENEEYDSFQSMLRDGDVYFKAARPIPYTVNCFDNEPRIAEALRKSVANAPLQFHDDLSVGLLNILKLVHVARREIGSKQDERRQQLTLNPFAVETCFGYWVPNSYYGQVDEKIRDGGRNKAKQLLLIGESLNRLNSSDVAQQISDVYLPDIERRLDTQAIKLTANQRKKIEDKILRRVATLQSKLSNEKERDRLARPISSVPVPEIWEDPHSRREMMDSFCECLAWKLDHAGKMPRIIGKLKSIFKLERGDTPEEIRMHIEARFQVEKVKRSEWL